MESSGVSADKQAEPLACLFCSPCLRIRKTLDRDFFYLTPQKVLKTKKKDKRSDEHFIYANPVIRVPCYLGLGV